MGIGNWELLLKVALSRFGGSRIAHLLSVRMARMPVVKEGTVCRFPLPLCDAREFSGLSASRQVGYHASTNADAGLGYSVMGRRSYEPAFASRHAGRSVIVRPRGQGSKRPNWPCYATLTHLAIPLSFVPGMQL